MKIGVLDIQGSVEEHFKALKKLSSQKVEPVKVKTVDDLKKVRGLIIPGGESTTIGKLLKRFGLKDEIIKLAKSGKLAIWGTCAGAILLAKKIVGDKQKDHVEQLGLMDIAVERNAYGRQIESFETQLEFNLGPAANWYGSSVVSGIFIRAPKIVSVGKNVKILAKYKNKIVAVRQGKFLATNFHPELTDEINIHQYFVKMCGD